GPALTSRTLARLPSNARRSGPRAIDRNGGRDVREVRERLREVPEHASTPRVVLLRVEAEVVRCRRGTLECAGRLLAPALAGQILGEPERARDECPFTSGQIVVGGVAADEAVLGEVGGDGVDGAGHPLVVGGDEAGVREEQQRRVDLLRSKRAPEGAAAVVVALPVDRAGDPVAITPPPPHGGAP